MEEVPIGDPIEENTQNVLEAVQAVLAIRDNIYVKAANNIR